MNATEAKQHLAIIQMPTGHQRLPLAQLCFRTPGYSLPSMPTDSFGMALVFFVCFLFFPGKLDIHNILVALPVNEQIPLRIAHYLLWGYDSLVLRGQDKVLIQESCVSPCDTVSITSEACSRLQVQGPFLVL